MMKERTSQGMRESAAWSIALLAALAAGCASRTIEVEIPPRVDLRSGTIGLVAFTGTPAGKHGETTTQRFMAAIQSAQPGVRIVELGDANLLLRTVGRERIDPETITLIGRRYQVDHVMTGNYEFSDAKPSVRAERDAVRASAWVHLSLSARLLDARDGATVWSNSRNGDWPVARLRVEAGQPISVGVSNPEDRYGEFMRQLVHAITEDFRPRYERRRVAR